MDDLVPICRSRRASESNAAHAPVPAPPSQVTSTAAAPRVAPSAAVQSPGAPHSAAAQAGLTPAPSTTGSDEAESGATPQHRDGSNADHLKASEPQSAVTTIYIGHDKKACHIDTAQLKDKSPYFRKLLAEDTGHAGKIASSEHTTFPDLDEFGCQLFTRWLTDGHKLYGPHDFHSFAHYLSLYVLANKFEIEALQNQGIISHRIPILNI